MVKREEGKTTLPSQKQLHYLIWNFQFVSYTMDTRVNLQKRYSHQHEFWGYQQLSNKDQSCLKTVAANTEQKTNQKPQQSSLPTSISSWIVCKGSHLQWERRVLNEKSSTLSALDIIETKRCFSCLYSIHMFRQAKNNVNCRKKCWNSPHNTLLDGIEMFYSS